MKKLRCILIVCSSNLSFAQNPVAPPKRLPEIRLITENETVLEGKATKNFTIGYKGWAKGNYYLEVTMLEIPQLITSGGYGFPLIATSFSPVNLQPTYSFVQPNGLSAAPALNSYPFTKKEKLKFRLLVR